MCVCVCVCVFFAEGSDYEAISWDIVFSSSSTGLVCVEVATKDDTVPELIETFSVSIQLVQPDTQISVQPSTIEITIENDDGKCPNK